MAFKTRRQHRYYVLRAAGFLPFESRELSRISFSVPYMDVLVRTRFKELNKALDNKMSRAEWERRIKTRYFDNGWRRWSRQHKAIYDTWKMLRDFESDYRVKHPAYESPWEKRRRSWKDFTEKIERLYNQPPQKGMRGRNLSIEREREELNQRIVRAISDGDQKLRRQLEQERNRRFGY